LYRSFIGVTFLTNKGDRLEEYSSEKAGVGGSTPSLATKNLIGSFQGSEYPDECAKSSDSDVESLPLHSGKASG
jgi:hypothetical protein